MRIRTRFITAALAAALLLAVALTTYLHAQSSATTDVRIAARLLENGKVEFGLQQRGPSGWGERILPTKNKFPADAEVGRWLRSTSVTIGVLVDTESLGTWKLTEWGHYELESVSEYQHIGGRDRLRLACGTGEPVDVPFVFLISGRQLPDEPRMLNVTYRVGETRLSNVRWNNLTSETLGSSVYAPDPAGFAAWLLVNYTPGRLFDLTVWGGSPYSVRSSGYFNLTGLPAVLADLPCFALGGEVRRGRREPATRSRLPSA